MFYLKFKVNDQNYMAACVFQADGHVKSAQHLKDNGAIIPPPIFFLVFNL